MSPSFIKKELKTKTIILILGGLTILNLGVHLYRLSYPAVPVFDEIHFATYAADYVNGTSRFDIHSPFGKAIYGFVLAMSDRQNIGGAEFVEITTSSDTGKILAVSKNVPYGNFPYLLLRLTSVFFGLLLPIALYYFLRSVSVGQVSSLVGAFLVTVDTSLLLETRLILLNGMFLVFGFISLALYFKNKNIWLAGLFFGLALSVKFTAICFLGPILISFLISRRKRSEIAKASKFLATGTLLLGIVYVLNFAIFPITQQDKFMSSVLNESENLSQTESGSKFFSQVIFFSLANYISDSGDPHLYQSSWYEWPLAQKPILYYPASGGKNIALSGNYAIWYSVLIAVAASFTLIFKFTKKYLADRSDDNLKAFFILFGGYIFCILPYVSIVRRTTFLYHYFPALIFGIGLLVWLLEQFNVRRSILIIGMVLIVLGFVVGAGCVYGIACATI